LLCLLLPPLCHIDLLILLVHRCFSSVAFNTLFPLPKCSSLTRHIAVSFPSSDLCSNVTVFGETFSEHTGKLMKYCVTSTSLPAPVLLHCLYCSYHHPVLNLFISSCLSIIYSSINHPSFYLSTYIIRHLLSACIHPSPYLSSFPIRM
jgi:hypothetical protein